MQRKTFLGIFLLTSIFYYIIPLLFLKFYNGTSDKAGFILILVYGFTSFAITLLISHFIQKTINSNRYATLFLRNNIQELTPFPYPRYPHHDNKSIMVAN